MNFTDRQQVQLQEIFSLLLREKSIGRVLVEKILHWHPTHISLHSTLKAQIKQEAERVGKYMIWPLLSLQRLTFDESERKACYQCGKPCSEEELFCSIYGCVSISW